jgi:hypothetical protein
MSGDSEFILCVKKIRDSIALCTRNKLIELEILLATEIPTDVSHRIEVELVELDMRLEQLDRIISEYNKELLDENIINEKFVESICINMLKYDGLLLEHIKNQTYDICLRAIRQNGCAFKYAKFGNYDFLSLIQEAAKHRNPMANLEIVKRSSFYIRFIAEKDRTKELMDAAYGKKLNVRSN